MMSVYGGGGRAVQFIGAEAERGQFMAAEANDGGESQEG